MSVAKSTIFVVGACNTDLITYADRHPLPGETLRGNKFVTGFGGKGANQAVQAAALADGDCRVTMLGKVGTDSFGVQTLENFRRRGVSTEHVHSTAEASSGVAPIVVAASGQNSILIVGGANDLLTVEEVRAATDDIRSADWLLGQLEVPLHITLEAFRLAKAEPSARHVRTLLNTAPAVAPPLSADFLELLRLSDVVCPNEVELAQLTGSTIVADAPHFLDDVQAAAARLLSMCAPGATVVSTVGSRGCVVSTALGHVHVEPPLRIPAERVVDTSGAGDSFIGALAASLVEMGPDDLVACARRAQYASALSVCKPGTQSSYPSRQLVERYRNDDQCDLSVFLSAPVE